MVRCGKSSPARVAIAASTGWMRSAKRVMISSSHLRWALARCDWDPGNLLMPRATSVSDAAEIKSEASFASHHSSKGLAFGVASILKSGVSINQVLMFSPFIPLEVEFDGKGNAEERLAKLGGVGQRLGLFGGRRRRVFRLDGILRRWPDHGDQSAVVGNEAAFARWRRRARAATGGLWLVGRPRDFICSLLEHEFISR